MLLISHFTNSIKQDIRKEEKQSNLLKLSINRKTHNLITRINTVNTEYVTKHETEDFDLLYMEMQRKDTHKDILENTISENPTGFTEKDAILISNRIVKLENLAFMVGIYRNNEDNKFNKITQEALGMNSLKGEIQQRIDAVTKAM